MSELEDRKYTSIRTLREEIRQDMKDYDLFIENWMPLNDWFKQYLHNEILRKINLLKELVEQNNE